jgi:hypothetical protein
MGVINQAKQDPTAIFMKRVTNTEKKLHAFEACQQSALRTEAIKVKLIP